MQPINVDPGELIGTKEAAEILDVSEREVRWKIQRKKIAAIKIGTAYVLQRSAVLFYQRARIFKRRRKERLAKQKRQQSPTPVSPQQSPDGEAQ